MNIINDMAAIGDKVLIQPIEDTKESALVIPEDAKERPQKGIALVVGADISDIPQGYTVYYRKGAGMPITIDEKDYLVMRRNDCFLAIKTLEAGAIS